MGAVRIYKDAIGDRYFPWQIRSNGCTVPDALICGFGVDHGGYCTGHKEYEEILDELNYAHTELGEYLKK